MTRLFSKPDRIFLIVVLLLGVGIYATGMGNELVFDDRRLVDGSIYGAYGDLSLRPRWLSYGSFVWLTALFGDGWPLQRGFNLLLHLGTALGLWVLLRGVMAAVSWQRDGEDTPSDESLGAAAAAGVALFALNPVAVYGVAYLVQRSVLMAAFFAVWALVAVLRGARDGGWPALVLAAVLYGLAMVSKEHALMLPLPAMALWFIARRASRRTVVLSLAGAAVVTAAVATVLAVHYGDVLGRAFDTRSTQFLADLEARRPGVAADAWGLSIVNQAWLFFRYGLLWMLPYVGWMSADLRPPFPLGFGAFPQMLGIPLYLTTLLGSIGLMVRFADWRRFLGFGLFLPASLFATEFATVWIQDPFVLYRSYLWAAGMPFLFAFPFIGARPRTVFIVAGTLALVFGGLSTERLLSFRSNSTLWADVAQKHDLQAGPAAVGRGRAFMWRGNDMIVRGMAAAALQDYERALATGEPAGAVQYHRAAALKLLGQPQPALDALAASEAAGGDPDAPSAVPFLRSQILFELRRYEDAGRAASQALAVGLDPDERVVALGIRAKAAVRAGQNREAADDFRAVLALDGHDRQARIGLALAMRALGEHQEALAELDRVLAEKDGPDVRFGRAMVLDATGDRAAALDEARKALAFKPDDPSLRGLVAKLGG